jgi:hypothetical protein
MIVNREGLQPELFVRIRSMSVRTEEERRKESKCVVAPVSIGTKWVDGGEKEQQRMRQILKYSSQRKNQRVCTYISPRMNSSRLSTFAFASAVSCFTSTGPMRLKTSLSGPSDLNSCRLWKVVEGVVMGDKQIGKYGWLVVEGDVTDIDEEFVEMDENEARHGSKAKDR